MVIMTVYKISTHAGIISTLVFLLTVFFSHWFWLSYLLVALVAWSRVELKVHHLGEVIWGAVLPPVILSLAFRVWGIPAF